MYYTIYKTTNKIDDKYYIGKHQTKNLDDGYLGSGKLLKRAIEKYGVKNFTKEILHVFDNEKDMNVKEAELVVVSEETYNLCSGGYGGFGYINREKNIVLKRTQTLKKNNHYSFIGKMIKGKQKSSEHQRKITEALQGRAETFKGRKHSEETKEKIRQKMKTRTPWNKGKVWVSEGVWK